ncbi:MAG TPA: hypothetical protein VH416_02135 [Gaiellaceae bacterium]|jgi:hypothetical protein
MVELVDVEQRIASAIAARRPVLEQLAREMVEAELVHLVDAELDRVARLVAASVNGAAPADDVAPDPPAELCDRCHQRQRLAGRRICRSCKAKGDNAARRVRRRDRRETPAVAAQDGQGDEEPRPADLPPAGDVDGAQGARGISARELLQRSTHGHWLRAGELHGWLIRSGFAEDGDGLLRPTPLGIELAEFAGALSAID